MQRVQELWRSKWWLPIVSIFLASRITTFFLFLGFAQIQEDNYWTKARPSYFDFLNIWDVEWYHRIFTDGYASVLPTNPDGTVQQNNWAFMPVFPYLVRALNFLTGVEWKILAPIVATIFAFAFILVAYKLLLLRLSESQSRWAITLISFSMASPILQVGYAESLWLLLIAASLYFFIQRRDVLLVISLTVLSVTRPGLLAFALMFALLFVYHLVRERKHGEEFAQLERVRLASLTVLSAFLGFVWLIVAALATGRFDAYLKTEVAWRAGYTGNTDLQPFTGWFVSGAFHLGDGFGQIVVFGLIAFAGWAINTASVKGLGVELRFWSIAYIVYLLAVFFPQSSTPRILFGAFPLLAAVAVATDRQPRVAKIALLALSILSQVVWLLVCWKYTAPDFTPP
jgi:Gpi18-like mannosyltransferase